MWFLDSMKLTVKLTGEVTVEHIPLKLVEYQGLYAVITIDRISLTIAMLDNHRDKI